MQEEFAGGPSLACDKVRRLSKPWVFEVLHEAVSSLCTTTVFADNHYISSLLHQTPIDEVYIVGGHDWCSLYTGYHTQVPEFSGKVNGKKPAFT
jgi:hypothetical protein